MKPLRIDTSRMNMLDKALWNIACGNCDKLQAKWEMKIPPAKYGEVETQVPVCALCFLYETQWGKDRAVDISGYLAEVAAVDAKRKMILNPDGGLTNIDDADFIVGIFALTSRRFDVEDLQLAQQKSGES